MTTPHKTPSKARASQAKNRGIWTLEDLRQRCYIDDVTKCWVWKGATVRFNDRRRVETRVWLANDSEKGGRVVAIAQASWILAGGKEIPGHRRWATCRNSLCGCPSHVVSGTAIEHGAWLKSEQMLRDKVTPKLRHRLRMARIDSGRTVLTEELAQWIRESEQGGSELARELAVHKNVVSKVRNGRTWRPQMAAASVFSLGASNTAVFRRSA